MVGSCPKNLLPFGHNQKPRHCSSSYTIIKPTLLGSAAKFQLFLSPYIGLKYFFSSLSLYLCPSPLSTLFVFYFFFIFMSILFSYEAQGVVYITYCFVQLLWNLNFENLICFCFVISLSAPLWVIYWLPQLSFCSSFQNYFKVSFFFFLFLFFFHSFLKSYHFFGK